MSQPSPAEPRARLFFALVLPDAMRRKVVAWQHEHLNDPALRATEPEALHITLCFLGSRPESQIAELAATLDSSLTDVVAPVELALERAPLPLPRRRPKLFALGAASETASELQARLVGALAQAGLFEPEKRPFWAHITVARVSTDPRGKRRPRRVEKPPRELSEGLLSPFHAVRVALYRSYLRPGGSHYVSLASLELPHPGSTGAEKR